MDFPDLASMLVLLSWTWPVFFSSQAYYYRHWKSHICIYLFSDYGIYLGAVSQKYPGLFGKSTGMPCSVQWVYTYLIKPLNNINDQIDWLMIEWLWSIFVWYFCGIFCQSTFIAEKTLPLPLIRTCWIWWVEAIKVFRNLYHATEKQVGAQSPWLLQPLPCNWNYHTWTVWCSNSSNVSFLWGH